MPYPLLTCLIALATHATASPLRERLSLRTCQDRLSPQAEFYVRREILGRADRMVGDVDHLMLSNFRRLDPEVAARRAFAVDEVLELLAEQRPDDVVDRHVRRRTWQMRLFGDPAAAPPGLAVMLLGDRLRWDDARHGLSDGEFVLLLRWEEPAPPALIESLPDLIRLAHAGDRRHAWPLRLVRAGDPFDGELFVVVDAPGEVDRRLARALDLLRAVQLELAELAQPARRP